MRRASCFFPRKLQPQMNAFPLLRHYFYKHSRNTHGFSHWFGVFGMTAVPLMWMGGLCSFFDKSQSMPFVSVPNMDLFHGYPALSSKMDDEKAIEALEQHLNSLSLSLPDMFSLSEIMNWVGAQASENQVGQLSYYVLEGCDALVTPTFTCMANSIRQVASQFNSGESPGRYETHPKDFQYDHTQGPAEQQTAFIAALMRWLYKDECDSLSAFKKYPEFETYFDYQHGYLTPRCGYEQAGLEFLKSHINEILLNVQRVGIDGTNQSATQVLNSALALGAYDDAREQRTEAGNRVIVQMSELLLTAQYKAVAAVAIREARLNPDQRIPVCFTAVGGGVFENNPEAIKTALGEACDLMERSGLSNIDVCFSAYQSSEAEMFGSKHFEQATIVTEEQLSQLSSLSALSAKSFVM